MNISKRFFPELFFPGLFFLGLSSVLFLSSAQAEGRTAEQVYNATCATCHTTGVANAPKLNDVSAWKAKGKSLEDFLITAKTGLNAMPPKGLCADCSDAELKATIEYMMQPAKK